MFAALRELAGSSEVEVDATGSVAAILGELSVRLSVSCAGTTVQPASETGSQV